MDKLVTCKTCGAGIAKSAKQCPQCGAKNRPPHRVLKTALVIVGAIIFVSILFGESSSDPQKVGVKSGESATESTLEKNVFSVGETVELDNVRATLVSVESSKGEPFLKPTEGNVFVTCEFEIENNTSKDIAVSTMMSFDCYFDGYAANLDVSAIATSGKTQLDGTIAAGKKMRGVVGYQAPSGWNAMEIHYHPSFWSKEIIFSAMHE